VAVDVTSSVALTSYSNTIAAGALQTGIGNNAVGSTATLAVNSGTGSLQVLKTLYQGKNSGAGCPGVVELLIVDSSHAPKDITWCFAVTNTGNSYLASPSFDDAGLSISASLNQGKVQLKSGVLPLAPGASATWYVEEVRTTSLRNTVTVSMTPSDAAGAPTGPAINGSSTGSTVFAYVFDPPFGIKTGVLNGKTVVRWNMVWINDNLVTANNVTITDPPPVGMTYAGNIACTPQGSTVVKSCIFEAASAAFPRGRVVVLTDLGPDFGATDAASAINELQIAFDATIDNPTLPQTFENQGKASWDPGTGTPLTVTTNAPSSGGGPTLVPFTPEVVMTSVPTLSEWGLILLAFLMAGLASAQARRQPKARR